MKDDAIAPVIAVMLILAAIVTFLSIWNAIYVPSMKESAEVEHLHNVEESFQKFSSDIDYAATSHQNDLVFSEPVQLGGGDTEVNLLKSSGALNVQNEENPIYNITFFNSTGSVIGELNDTLINFSYEPTGNFWQNQGYQWQFGYINVTKNNAELKTPLLYYTMDNVTTATETGSLATLAKSFVTVGYTVNQSGGLPGNCSSLDIMVVNITASPQYHFISSNGFGTLKLTSNVISTPFDNPIANIAFESDQEPFGNATTEGFNNTLYNKVSAACGNNIWEDPTFSDPASHQYQYDINQLESPVNVNLTVVEINVEAY
jgi:FlaG/FlaF family flagellin (archaellin)